LETGYLPSGYLCCCVLLSVQFCAVLLFEFFLFQLSCTKVVLLISLFGDMLVGGDVSLRLCQLLGGLPYSSKYNKTLCSVIMPPRRVPQKTRMVSMDVYKTPVLEKKPINWRVSECQRIFLSLNSDRSVAGIATSCSSLRAVNGMVPNHTDLLVSPVLCTLLASLWRRSQALNV
jgi:hypothetical protein